MNEREQPTTQAMKALEVRQQWGQLLDEVFAGKKRVLIEKSGVPVAALVSAQDLARMVQLEGQRAERFTALDQSWEAFRDIPDAEVEKEVTKALAEVRAKNRRRPRRRAGTA